MEEQMLFNYDDEIDDFDDEPQDLLLDKEDDADLDSDFPKDEDPLEAEPEMMDKQDDDSNESNSYDRIAEILGEDELVEVPSPLILVNPMGELFRLYEQNNNAYTDAMTAYFEEKNYQQAIEKFDEAIADASQRTERDLTEAQAGEIVAKSMYWQAEAYVKTQNIQQAVETFKALIQGCQGHYLTLAAQRRSDELNAGAS
jgi:tetratricopeptide (TPR) repeat protein